MDCSANCYTVANAQVVSIFNLSLSNIFSFRIKLKTFFSGVILIKTLHFESIDSGPNSILLFIFVQWKLLIPLPTLGLESNV